MEGSRARKAVVSGRIREGSYGRTGIDMPFLIIVVMLLLVGLIVMFTASYASAYYRFGDSYHFVKQQFKFALLGLAVMTGVSFFATPKMYRMGTVPLYILSVVLLVLVLFIGTELNGAKRWIYIGTLSIQPSEIAKISLVFIFALMIDRFRDKMGTFRYGILPFVGLLGLLAGLIALEKHVSATLIICIMGAVMLFIGGVKLYWFIGAAVAGGAGITALILTSQHAMDRINIWQNPWLDPQGDGFQTIQSLYAIGSGGLFGLGLGQSRQKYLYIPEPQNDFIFSIAAEELGFVGAVIIILLFALLIWRGFLIAFRTPDRFLSMVVVGLTSKVALQALLNIAVVTNTVPNTGIALPFFSYGGTALVMQLAEMGVILSISRYSRVIKG